jgi:hypothetical protein
VGCLINGCLFWLWLIVSTGCDSTIDVTPSGSLGLESYVRPKTWKAGLVFRSLLAVDHLVGTLENDDALTGAGAGCNSVVNTCLAGMRPRVPPLSTAIYYHLSTYLSIICLSVIYQSSIYLFIYLPSIIYLYLSTIYLSSSIYLSSIYHLFSSIIYLSFVYLSSILSIIYVVCLLSTYV